VAALLGVRDSVTYEGQAAIELEQRVDLSEPGAYAARIDDKLVVHGEDFIRSAVDDLRRGLGVAQIAARFHRGLAAALVDAVDQVRDRTGVTTVALSGGVFQNVVLLTHCVADLEAKGFQVLTHTRVPPNDGGISLGQAAVAAATAFAD
jgi:hydrogenase maturation protein HypF